jgi:hypothetical protein
VGALNLLGGAATPATPAAAAAAAVDGDESATLFEPGKGGCVGHTMYTSDLRQDRDARAHIKTDVATLLDSDNAKTQTLDSLKAWRSETNKRLAALEARSTPPPPPSRDRDRDDRDRGGNGNRGNRGRGGRGNHQGGFRHQGDHRPGHRKRDRDEDEPPGRTTPPPARRSETPRAPDNRRR